MNWLPVAHLVNYFRMLALIFIVHSIYFSNFILVFKGSIVNFISSPLSESFDFSAMNWMTSALNLNTPLNFALASPGLSAWE